ncbi:MAG: FAD-dependent oxidoreductase, partial [Candidatus Thermoplasmatota archaeon]|nr:FAD-dependent oxidoreductase [Candidatus Thermoplasmatota archaeon]
AHLARRGREFGVDIQGDIEVDLARVVERKDEIVDRIEAVNLEEVEETEGIDYYAGTARFTDPHTLAVDGQPIRGELIILATGARPMVPAWPGIEGVDVLTSRELLDLKEKPEHLIVVGGGYIGLESAQMSRRFGSQVTVLQRSLILKEEDQDIIDRLRDRLDAEGIELHEGTGVTRVQQEGDTITVEAERDGKALTFEGDALLVAVGRLPNAQELDLEAAGVDTWGPGWLRVDERMRTSQPHIYGVGDATGEHLFTHVARYEVEVAVANALDGEDVEVNYWAAPHAVFTDPELARVGMTLAEAEAAGYDAMEVDFTYEHLGKALCLGEEEGVMKVVAEQGTGKLLGMHILANHAGELIHEAVVQMHREGSVDDLADAIHIHPTLAEGVNDVAFEAAIELGRRRF